jgi:DNA-binding NarL/FixJ family response regulator
MADTTTPLEPVPPGSLVMERPASEAHRRAAVSVVVVDDHAAVRLGLNAAISARPGLVCVGALPDGELLPNLLYRARPDVLVLDYDLPRINGLELCRWIKADVPAPAVVLYSAYADQAMTIPALVAGVDAMVHKGAPARELFAAIETVAAGGKDLAAPVPELAQAAAGAVDPADRALLELLLRHTPPSQAATRLGLDPAEVTQRIERMLERLTCSAR